MSGVSISIGTDRFYKDVAGEDRKAGNVAARRAVAKTLRALADELDKGEYVGGFCLPMVDTTGWTAEQCLASFKGTRFERMEDTDRLSLEVLRVRARFTSPDAMHGAYDER